jgi:hypothetical protein
MNRNNCLPLFFAVKGSDSGFQVFQNEIYQSFKSLGFPANVLWPVALEDMMAPRVLRQGQNDEKKHNTFIKRWNSHWHKSSSWTYTDLQLELIIDNEIRMIPVVNIDCDNGTLPFNNAILRIGL